MKTFEFTNGLFYGYIKYTLKDAFTSHIFRTDLDGFYLTGSFDTERKAKNFINKNTI